MIYRTSHGGRMIHVPIERGLEQQRVGDSTYIVATGTHWVDGSKEHGWSTVDVWRHKPGVMVASQFRGGFGVSPSETRRVYVRDEYVPASMVCTHVFATQQ